MLANAQKETPLRHSPRRAKLFKSNLDDLLDDPTLTDEIFGPNTLLDTLQQPERLSPRRRRARRPSHSDHLW